MTTLAGKTILIIGGSSGIGYAVAKASLIAQADHVIIGSSNQQKIRAAITRLATELPSTGAAVQGKLTGEIVDEKDSASIRALFARVGEVDHLVWRSGDRLRLGFPRIDLDENKDSFDARFWGPFAAAQVARIRPGGSITLTIGGAISRPRKGWSLMAGVFGAVDSLIRGLAVDLAPIRVNVVSPGLVKTELWDGHAPEAKNKILEDTAKNLLVQHVADPDEIAEAYIFLMKCGYITGQRIEVDGGAKLV
ncbi:short-chain dehydrogenase/reductase SDR [Fomitiporia mediterranea MF3/22]|uniref:short-chain dehydrogenase/reductase SDR n=1 Tax=Fomitiporia mediterranea (strain MF3/22) TaxID=694068 RepID=UPI0004409177|nr:short-chain dehydrogenase/reductase SDR [Fomitiporia mediterranea MF3/22]EJD02503.1 short-chain dehydrogenase/reductase SDR [Fomitiporia mediterranea MF3/22]